jgi:4-hydroxybenzoate polyprenyltransferase
MLERLKSYIEKIQITPISWLIGISGILMVRFFLEAFSSKTSSGIIASDASTLIHYYLFFIATALVLMVFLWFAVPSWRQCLPQFAVCSFILVLLAPIIDFLISRGSGLQMTYLFETPRDMFFSFLTFFGPNWHQGITLGMRIELALILFLTSFLVYKTSRNILRTIISFLVLYAIMFFFVSLPGIISIASGTDVLNFLSQSIINSASLSNNLHSTFVYFSEIRLLEIGFNFLMAKILFVFCLSLLVVWFYLSKKSKLIAVLKNSRPERVLAYFSSILLGMLLAYFISPPQFFSGVDYLSVFILFLSFYFSWAFAVCVNDIVDKDIDAVSNTDRPLIASELSENDMKQTAFIFLTASLVGGYLSGFYAFFSILVFTALYYIYSAPPTRFKLIPFFSTFIIGLCNLSAAVAGFFIISNSKILASFPTEAIFGIVIFFSLLPNIRDIKDIEGDTKEGVMTVPVLFGPVHGPKVVGIMAGAAYLIVPLFSGFYYLFILAIPAAVATYYFCTRHLKKPISYKESYVFVVYFLFFILAAILFLFF